MKDKIQKRKIGSLIEEAMAAGGTIFGGAGGGGSGTFSYIQHAGAKTWAPSPRTRSANTFNIKDIGDEEHLFKHQSPKKRPFPMEDINEYLVQAYLQLSNAESQMKTCDKYNAMLINNKEKRELLRHTYKKTKAVKELIRKISLDLDKIIFS